jgi:hypothetical protein
MQKVLAGVITKDDIPSIESRRFKVCAAVAYMLLHWEQYLTPDLALKEIGAYSAHLASLTPGLGSELVAMSLRLGLHTTESFGGRKRVTLTPPPELDPPVLQHQRRAAEILAQLAKNEPPDVLACLYYEIQKQLYSK